MTQDRGGQIRGLVEDGCIPYAASCRAAGLDTSIQRDVWHALEDAHHVLRDLERETSHALNRLEKQEKSLRKRWQEPIFEQWVAQTEQGERLLAQRSAMRFEYGTCGTRSS